MLISHNLIHVAQLNDTEQSASARSGLQKNSGDCPVERNVQTSIKLKLQLFPIDESTRKALEMVEHCSPFTSHFKVVNIAKVKSSLWIPWSCRTSITHIWS